MMGWPDALFGSVVAICLTLVIGVVTARKKDGK